MYGNKKRPVLNRPFFIHCFLNEQIQGSDH